MILLLIDIVLNLYFNIHTYFILYLFFEKKSLIEVIIVGLFLDLIIYRSFYITILLVIIYFLHKFLFKNIHVFRNYILAYIISFLIFVNISFSFYNFIISLVISIILYFIYYKNIYFIRHEKKIESYSK